MIFLKKFFLIFIIIVFVFSITFAAEDLYYELSNNRKCLSCATKIAEITDADDIAILYRDKNLLCGINLKNHSFSENDKNQVLEILKSDFPAIKNFRLEVNSSMAQDILELSYYSSKNIHKYILSSRFDFLLNKR